MGALEAVDYIHKRRRFAHPNPSFMQQLMQLESKLVNATPYSDEAAGIFPNVSEYYRVNKTDQEETLRAMQDITKNLERKIGTK